MSCSLLPHITSKEPWGFFCAFSNGSLGGSWQRDNGRLSHIMLSHARMCEVFKARLYNNNNILPPPLPQAVQELIFKMSRTYGLKVVSVFNSVFEAIFTWKRLVFDCYFRNRFQIATFRGVRFEFSDSLPPPCVRLFAIFKKGKKTKSDKINQPFSGRGQDAVCNNVRCAEHACLGGWRYNCY